MDCTRFAPPHITSPRYYASSESEFDTNENKNTKRKTETDMRIFLSYLVSINESREPETIPAEELDSHLATYFSVIKKHDGNEYEPASLRGMLCSIERYLRSKNYPVSLTRDPEFTNTRNMLKERQKVLRELVKTEKYNKPETIASSTVHRLNQLYLAKEFGPHNPSSVINALCFAFVVNLKIRKAIDHKQLLWGDISLKVSPANEEYLCYEPLSGFEYCRLPLKGISGHKVIAQKSDTSLWDPITIYKLYRHKRPSSMMSPESPFYLGIAVQLHESLQQPWFKTVAMGVNKLNDLVRMIRDLTGSNNVIDLYNTTRCSRDEIKVDEYPQSKLKYKPPLDENTDSNDLPVDMSPTAKIPSDAEKKQNESITMDELKEKDRKTDVNTEFITAKDKIKTVLDSISTEARYDIMQWLFPKTETGEGSCRQDKVNQSSSRKRLRVTFELDNKDIDEYTCFDKIAKIQVVPALDMKNDHENRDTKINTPENSVHDDDFETTSDVEAESDTPNEKDETTDSKQKQPNDCPEKDLEKPNSPSSQHNVQKPPSPDTNKDVGNKTTDMKLSINGYNPYAAWAIDPRFAMFMRSGFIQTYQDFVNIYTNPELKDSHCK